MRNYIRSNSGFTLVEVAIAMVIGLIILAAAYPGIQSGILSSRVDAMSSHIEEIRRGMSECRSRFNTYTSCTTTRIQDEGFIADKIGDNLATANPWGGSYTITPAAQSFTIVVAGIGSTKACQRGQTTYTQMGGVTATCAGTTLTLVFNT